LAYRLGCATFYAKPARFRLILDEVALLLGLRVRSAKRYPVAISGWLHADSRDFEVQTGNVSASGMFFETQCTLDIDRVYSAVLEFVVESGPEGHEFCFRVVRRVQPDGTQNKASGYGVEFVFDDEAKCRDFETFLKSLYGD
jgi:hypothetical protein